MIDDADLTGVSAGPLRGSPVGPLAGLSAWIVTDGKKGMDVQCLGVAEALGLDYEMKTVAPRGLYRLAAPRGPISRTERFGQEGSQFAPPWPAIAIATGRLSIPYIRALGRLAGPRTYRIVLQDPRTGPKTGDLIWVPQHDRRRGPNVITTLTAPHSFSQRRLDALRAAMPPEIAALPHPRVTVVLGGKNAVYKFSAEDDRRFANSLKSIAALGASFMITTSRRTHEGLARAARDATAGAPRLIWDGEGAGSGANPYADFLAGADMLVVTADSVNMTGEAAATGRPVYVFEPGSGSAKFTRFHQALRHYGATRPLPEAVTSFEQWDYVPLDAAATIAAEAQARWSRRAKMLRGLVADKGT